MVKLDEGLDYVKVFLDDTGILGKGDFVQHKRVQSRPKEMTIVVANERAKTKCQFRKFHGSINFCRKFWKCRSRILSLFTDLTGNKPFKWKDVHQNAFDAIKSIMAKEAMLYCPNFNLSFLVFPDASGK